MSAKKQYKYSLSFDGEMGEWFEMQRDRFRKRSVSKTVQSLLEPDYLNWKATKMIAEQCGMQKNIPALPMDRTRQKAEQVAGPNAAKENGNLV